MASIAEKRMWEYEFPVGILGIAEDGEGITDIFSIRRAEPSRIKREETPLLNQAARELSQYFSGNRKRFEVRLHLEGTPFQRKVWEVLCTIPYGETRSYGQVARLAGNARACRAVGMANNRNPVMIMVPCHRVIGADKSLVGYGGGLSMKEFLLKLEKEHIEAGGDDGSAGEKPEDKK